MSYGTLHVEGRNGTRDLALTAECLTLGRGSDCHVVLDDGYVSRTHARLFRDPFGRWIIEDLGSHNGIRVNEKPVTKCSLSPHDTIEISPFRMTILCEDDRYDRPQDGDTSNDHIARGT